MRRTSPFTVVLPAVSVNGEKGVKGAEVRSEERLPGYIGVADGGSVFKAYGFLAMFADIFRMNVPPIWFRSFIIMGPALAVPLLPRSDDYVHHGG